MRRVRPVLIAADIRIPLRVTLTGKVYGGCWFSCSQLCKIMADPIYVGDMPRRCGLYPGQHPPIMAGEMFDTVRAKRPAGMKGKHQPSNSNASPLTDRIVGEAGEPPVAADALKTVAATGQAGPPPATLSVGYSSMAAYPMPMLRRFHADHGA